MVATFYLHCPGHRIKYWNPEVTNTTQQSYQQSFLFWGVLITYNTGVYICIYIYKVSYIYSFSVIFNCDVFLQCMLNILRYEKIFCEIDESISNPSCDVIFLGFHSESTFPFMEYFFLKKTVFHLVSLSLDYRWVNQPRYFW